jgi:hypothetical protein
MADFNPNLPTDHSPVSAVEVRNQLNPLQDQINRRAKMTHVGEFDPGFSNPPTTADREAIRDVINIVVEQLHRVD